MAKHQRRFQEIRAVDYFDSPGAHDARMMLERAEKALSRGPASGPEGVCREGVVDAAAAGN